VAQPLPASTATAQPGVAPAPAPTVVQLAPVDLGRAEWVQAMIDRIAELPQAEGGREAQIRLAPDALGKVEVTIVQRDEQTQVTLNAETAQARQLLSDAAPRLQELAEARGLRLAHTEVGGGQPQDRRSHQEQQHPQTPQRPRPASAGSGDNPQPKGDLIA
jgi:flagellar hook-length control protein FliK